MIDGWSPEDLVVGVEIQVKMARPGTTTRIDKIWRASTLSILPY